MRILGVSAHYHDAAAALIVNGIPVAAVQEERLSRRKNDAAFPMSAIEWCLEQAGLEPDELDAVVFYERPMLKFDRILTCALRAFPRSWRSFPHAMKNTLGEKLWVRGIISGRADGRAWNTRTGPDGDHTVARNPLSPFAGNALFDLYGLSRLSGE